MADVARLAGVSHQTVSRVLNKHPNVRPQTRAGVLAAILELGYRPNAAARSLVTRRTNALGVISFDTTLYGPASMLHGIEQAARPDYSVTIASLPAVDCRAVLDAVEQFLGQSVEGIIVIAPQTSSASLLSGLTGEVPVIAVGCGILAPLDSVAIDNVAGAAAATQYLLDLGHRLARTPGVTAVFCANDQMSLGLLRALYEQGIRVPDDVSVIGFDDIPE